MKAKSTINPQPHVAPTQHPDRLVPRGLEVRICDSLWPLRDEAEGLADLIGTLNAEKGANPVFHSLLPLANSLHSRVETLAGYLDEAFKEKELSDES